MTEKDFLEMISCNEPRFEYNGILYGICFNGIGYTLLEFEDARKNAVSGHQYEDEEALLNADLHGVSFRNALSNCVFWF